MLLFDPDNIGLSLGLSHNLCAEIAGKQKALLGNGGFGRRLVVLLSAPFLSCAQGLIKTAGRVACIAEILIKGLYNFADAATSWRGRTDNKNWAEIFLKSFKQIFVQLPIQFTRTLLFLECEFVWDVGSSLIRPMIKGFEGQVSREKEWEYFVRGYRPPKRENGEPKSYIDANDRNSSEEWAKFFLS